MTRTVKVSPAIAAVIAAIGLVGCGSSSDDEQPAASSAQPPQSEDYELTRMSDVGIRQGFFTITGRTDGKTTAVVDFYVPVVEGKESDLYAVAVRSGDCDPTGSVVEDIGTISAGVTVQVLDVPVSELATQLDSNAASVVIMKPDGTSIAWCGPES